ncbi:MAG: hypothetical protein PW786_07235 [Arachidicoccus sp.]|nr:hypothetical protein [Arachidicoccus sp.]
MQAIYTKNSEADIAGKLKTNDGYAGSAQMNSDLTKTQLSADLDKQVYQKDAMTKVNPGTAMIRIEGAFNAKSGTLLQAVWKKK